MSSNSTERGSTDFPRVSVIMAVRGPAPWLQEALESISNQTIESWELRVGVDGHDPDVIRALEEFGSKVRWEVLPSGSGASACRNIALAGAQGKYSAVIDSDDTWHTNHLSQHLDVFERSDSLVLRGARASLMNERSQVVGTLKVPSRFLAPRLLLRNVFIHSSVMYRTDLARDLGGYSADMNVGEDLALWLCLARFGELENAAEPFVNYRHHSSQLSRAKMTTRSAEEILQQRLLLAKQLHIPGYFANQMHKVWGRWQ